MIITKEDLIKIIKEEIESMLEVAPQTGVYSVSKQNIAMAKRIEKMYRDAGLTKKADIFARAIEQGESGEIDYEQFSRLLDSASEV
jgi:PBP1b-binding outer membrane lipoprotein LpoB